LIEDDTNKASIVLEMWILIQIFGLLKTKCVLNIENTPSYTNKQHSNKQFLNKQYSKLQQKLPIVSTCKLPNLEFGLKFWHQILPIYLNDDFNNFA
jgi:hypothetical protein